jgi:outer membrane protein assembly factor BamA
MNKLAVNIRAKSRMKSLRLQISVLVATLSGLVTFAQDPYRLHLRGIDRDSSFLANEMGIPPAFTSRLNCIDYINKLPALLQGKGYVTASIDTLRFDSTHATLSLFLGEIYKWASLSASGVESSLLDAVGWRDQVFEGRPMDFSEVNAWQEKLLVHLENNGYPFARVYLDSLQLNNEAVTAKLRVDKGPSYRIDSIRVFGNVKVSNNFLQRYLDIPNGSTYNKAKLLQVGTRLRQLTYLEEDQPSNLTRLGTGSVLNLYLRSRRSSQVNVLVGFLPNNDQLSSKKLLITGEANINLRNALGSGETIGLNWQQLQVKSPRLNLVFQYPFVFNSPLGLDLAFDIFRKDSSFVNINLQIGASYLLGIHQAGKLFIQRFQTIVNGVNKNYIILNRRLSDEADISSLNVGVDYEFNNTNYRLNPRSGNELRIITSAGTKKLKKNNEILSLKDPGDPSFDFGTLYDTIKLNTYQFRTRITAAKYFPMGRQGTIKTGVNGGFFQSGNIFRNELFQIGGYKLLRGFDEESQYLSQFAIGTIEYRYLVGVNSYFYVLADGGWGRNNSQNNNVNYTYFGTGLGLAFETKAGIFNIAWAIGKRNDLPFTLRQSKLHFGFVNYF